MSQTYTDNVYTIAGSVDTCMAAVEDNFAALKSSFSGTSAPGSPVAGMWWLDTDASPITLYIRNATNTAWQAVWDLTNNKPVVSNSISADFGAAMKDAAAATASLRTLGTSATSACAGNDSRLGNIVPGNLDDMVGGYTTLLTAKHATNGPDGEWEVLGGPYTKKIEFTIVRDGDYDVIWEMRARSGGTAYSKVYKNGSASGTEQSTAATTYDGTIYYTAMTGLVATDKVQLYIQGSGGVYSCVRRVRLCGNDPNNGTVGLF